MKRLIFIVPSLSVNRRNHLLTTTYYSLMLHYHITLFSGECGEFPVWGYVSENSIPNYAS